MRLSFSQQLPDLQLAWDSTSIGALKLCPRYYQLNIVLGYVPREESVHLTFGLHYHGALEAYDHAKFAGASHKAATRAAVRYAMTATWDSIRNRPWTSDHKTKHRESLVRSVIWYLEQFAEDPLETVRLANGKPAVELSFRLSLGKETRTTGEPMLLCGHIDRVVHWQGASWVLDRKTTSYTLSPDFFERYAPDNQFSTYSYAGKVVFDQPNKGLIVDVAQVAGTFTRFQRGITPRTEEQLSEWKTDLDYWLSTAEYFAKTGYWPQNDKACVSGTTMVYYTRGTYLRKPISVAKLFASFHGEGAGTKFPKELRSFVASDFGGHVGENELLDVLDKGVRDTLRIYISEWEHIDVTPDHEMRQLFAWRHASDLKVGDELLYWPKKIRNKLSPGEVRYDSEKLSTISIKAIIPGPKIRVFDLVMAAPHHNFIANRLVAHNCSMFGGCQYRQICGKSPGNSRHDWLSAQYTKRMWDPLKTRGDI